MNEIKLSKKDRFNVTWRSQLLQGSWNYERMQNGGYVYSMIPAIKKLYSTDQQRCEALKRHLAFYNTQPFMTSPILGVSLSQEEDRANGKAISDEKIDATKVGMMGPLAAIGDSLFWFTLRPILAALGASLALSGNLLGPIIFFLLWNCLRFGFMWISQEKGYEYKEKIVDKLNPQFLQDISLGAGIAAMFIFGSLVYRFVIVDFTFSLPNLQSSLDTLMPGILSLGLTLGCCQLLKRKVSPLVLILGLILICILAAYANII